MTTFKQSCNELKKIQKQNTEEKRLNLIASRFFHDVFVLANSHVDDDHINSRTIGYLSISEREKDVFIALIRNSNLFNYVLDNPKYGNTKKETSLR
jgi:hypothetical protein